MADDITATVVKVMGSEGLSLYIHRERGTNKLIRVELVDRKNNHIYLEPGDGEVLLSLAPYVPS